MRKRPGAVVTAGGAVIALLCQAPASAQDGADSAREVSGGYAGWAVAATGVLSGADVSVSAGKPAVDGTGGRSWLPVSDGTVDPAAGDATVGFGGAVRLTAAGDTLTLGALRLTLDDGTGTLRARAELGGRTHSLDLAEVREGATAPVVRGAGVTWTGLRASLTAEGAELFAAWTGRSYEEGGELAPLDVTVGTGTGAAEPEPEPPEGDSGTEPSAPKPPVESPESSESSEAVTPEPPKAAGETAPAAVAEHPTVVAGGEQRVTGEGFEPGEVVLVAIDDDTRYQAKADASGRVSRAFPVYTTAVEGEHAVELYTVTGDRRAVAEFAVERS
ncbi:HtaA domain-containing protein [Streptomyces sp. NPDC002845]